MEAQTQNTEINDYLTQLEMQDSKVYYHATKEENLQSILEYGLHPKFGELYFSSNADSAARWVGMQRSSKIVVLAVRFSKKDKLKPGTDHHPFMESLFPGEVVVYNKPVYSFESITLYDLYSNASTYTRTMYKNLQVEGKTNAPWEKSKDEIKQLREQLQNQAREFLAKKNKK